MIRRSIVAATLATGLIAAPAFAATGPHGRGPDAQAAMLAAAANSGTHPVQVLNELCVNPARERGCTPMKARLERALEGAIDVSITWVSQRKPHGGQFWVFAPVRFGDNPVRSKVAWRDPGKYGCNGWTRIDWRRRHGVWSPFRGVGVVGCSAAP